MSLDVAVILQERARPMRHLQQLLRTIQWKTGKAKPNCALNLKRQYAARYWAYRGMWLPVLKPRQGDSRDYFCRWTTYQNIQNKLLNNLKVRNLKVSSFRQNHLQLIKRAVTSSRVFELINAPNQPITIFANLFELNSMNCSCLLLQNAAEVYPVMLLPLQRLTSCCKNQHEKILREIFSDDLAQKIFIHFQATSNVVRKVYRGLKPRHATF